MLWWFESSLLFYNKLLPTLTLCQCLDLLWGGLPLNVSTHTLTHSHKQTPSPFITQTSVANTLTLVSSHIFLYCRVMKDCSPLIATIKYNRRRKLLFISPVLLESLLGFEMSFTVRPQEMLACKFAKQCQFAHQLH